MVRPRVLETHVFTLFRIQQLVPVAHYLTRGFFPNPGEMICGARPPANPVRALTKLRPDKQQIERRPLKLCVECHELPQRGSSEAHSATRATNFICPAVFL
jgi:hypothetical protein